MLALNLSWSYLISYHIDIQLYINMTSLLWGHWHDVADNLNYCKSLKLTRVWKSFSHSTSKRNTSKQLLLVPKKLPKDVACLLCFYSCHAWVCDQCLDNRFCPIFSLLLKTFCIIFWGSFLFKGLLPHAINTEWD